MLFEPVCKDCLQLEMRNNAMFFCTDWCYYPSTANRTTASPVSYIPAKEVWNWLVLLFIWTKHEVCCNHSSFPLAARSFCSSLSFWEQDGNATWLLVGQEKGNRALNCPMHNGKCCQKNKVCVSHNLRTCLGLVQEQDAG